MTSSVSIYQKIGEPAMLEQIAEECAELAHSALKLARFLRDENPTPAPEAEIRQSFLEEVADVTLCIDEWLKNHDETCYDIVNLTMDEKEERWIKRLNGK